MKLFSFGLIGTSVLALAIGCGGDDTTQMGTAAGGAGGAAGSTATGSSGSSVGASGSGGASGTGGSTASTGGAGGNAGSLDAGSGGSGGTTDGGPDASDAKSTDGAPSDAKTDSTVGDAAPYDPCPPKGMPCVILPVGDSITQGAGSSDGGSYREPLFHLAHMNMQTITFVGSGADGPTMVDGVPFPRNHEGHSGYNIDATQGRMGVSPFFPAAITTYKPNIVLLMIGTNDVDTGETNIPDRLGKLMDSMLMPDPKLLLVVAQIVPQQLPEAGPDPKNTAVKAYNAAIPGVVKMRTDAGEHVVVVDMFGAFTANPNFSTVLLNDRLHPNDAGYRVMADTWYAAIRQYLK
jgi:hypothetical protein